MHSCAAAELCRLGLQLGRQLVNNTGQTKLKLKLKWQAHEALSGAYLDQNYLVFSNWIRSEFAKQTNHSKSAAFLASKGLTFKGL